MKKRTVVYAGERSSHQIKGDAPQLCSWGFCLFRGSFS